MIALVHPAILGLLQPSFRRRYSNHVYTMPKSLSRKKIFTYARKSSHPPLKSALYFGTDTLRIVIRAFTGKSPARVTTSTIRCKGAATLNELDLVPIASICDTREEGIVLAGAHCVDSNVEMPVLAEVIYRAH